MNIHLSCPSTCTVLTDIQKLLTHGMSNRGKFTLRNSKGYLQAKKSVRWRFVKKILQNYMASKSIYSIQKFSPNEAKP